MFGQFRTTIQTELNGGWKRGEKSLVFVSIKEVICQNLQKEVRGEAVRETDSLTFTHSLTPDPFLAVLIVLEGEADNVVLACLAVEGRSRGVREYLLGTENAEVAAELFLGRFLDEPLGKSGRGGGGLQHRISQLLGRASAIFRRRNVHFRAAHVEQLRCVLSHHSRPARTAALSTAINEGTMHSTDGEGRREGGRDGRRHNISSLDSAADTGVGGAERLRCQRLGHGRVRPGGVVGLGRAGQWLGRDRLVSVGRDVGPGGDDTVRAEGVRSHVGRGWRDNTSRLRCDSISAASCRNHHGLRSAGVSRREGGRDGTRL
ncbi:hypothetical protein PFISCL1PPCAC_3610, partial [Pristionchus fissidentatus]